MPSWPAAQWPPQQLHPFYQWAGQPPPIQFNRFQIPPTWPTSSTSGAPRRPAGSGSGARRRPAGSNTGAPRKSPGSIGGAPVAQTRRPQLPVDPARRRIPVRGADQASPRPAGSPAVLAAAAAPHPSSRRRRSVSPPAVSQDLLYWHQPAPVQWIHPADIPHGQRLQVSSHYQLSDSDSHAAWDPQLPRRAYWGA